MKDFEMTSDKVLNLYSWFQENGITIWVDGGWCIDALLNFQTRKHDDLDIAVSRKDNIKLRELLENNGWKEEKRDDSWECNYVMKSEDMYLIDVHVFEYDEQGKNIYGVPYPFGSLNGKGKINAQWVNCVNPEWMFKFKLWADEAFCKPREKDVIDAQILSQKFGFQLPENYR